MSGDLAKRKLHNADTMVPAEANRVGVFLQRQLLRDAREGQPVRLVIRHVVGAKASDRVDETTIEDPSKLGAEDIAPLALEIYKCAANDAEGRGKGEQRYALQCYTDKSPVDEPFSIVFRVVAGRQTPSDGYVDSDPPNEQGISAMLMRKLDRVEDGVGDLIESAVAMVASMRQQLSDLTAELRETRAERRQDLQMLEEARSAQWERERATRQLDAEVETKRELIGVLKAAVPPVLRRLGAPKGAPVATLPPEESQIYMIYKSMTSEQFDKFLGPDSPLDEKQKFLFADWVAYIGEQEKKKAAEGAQKSEPAK